MKNIISYACESFLLLFLEQTIFFMVFFSGGIKEHFSPHSSIPLTNTHTHTHLNISVHFPFFRPFHSKHLPLRYIYSFPSSPFHSDLLLALLYLMLPFPPLPPPIPFLFGLFLLAFLLLAFFSSFHFFFET